MTETVPKSLISVAGNPFIIHQLKYLKSLSLEKILICIGYLGELIQSLIGDGKCMGLEISYLSDGEKPLGTGGAIKQALKTHMELLENGFFVLYGDSFLPINFVEISNVFKLSNESALMTVYKNSNKWDISNVRFINEKYIEYNKMHPSKNMAYIDYGLSLFMPSAFKDIEENVFDLSFVCQKHSQNNQLMGYKVYDDFYEIGSREGLIRTENYLREREKNGIY